MTSLYITHSLKLRVWFKSNINCQNAQFTCNVPRATLRPQQDQEVLQKGQYHNMSLPGKLWHICNTCVVCLGGGQLNYMTLLYSYSHRTYVVHLYLLYIYHMCTSTHVIHVQAIPLYYIHVWNIGIVGVMHMYYRCVNYMCNTPKQDTCVLYMYHTCNTHVTISNAIPLYYIHVWNICITGMWITCVIHQHIPHM